MNKLTDLQKAVKCYWTSKLIRDEILSFGKNIPAVKKVKDQLDEINEELGLMMITHECVFKADKFRELHKKQKELEKSLELFSQMTEGYLNLE